MANRRSTKKQYILSMSEIYMLLICASYGFSGVNLFIGEIISEKVNSLGILWGILMLAMVPISWYDKRKEMRGFGNAIASCCVHIFTSFFSMGMYETNSVMIAYGLEVALIVTIIYIFRIHPKRRQAHSTGDGSVC